MGEPGQGDGFDKFYGSNAVVARQIVSAAMADWERLVPWANVKINLSALNLDGNAKDQNTLGRTQGTTIQMDKDAGEQGWYFDTNLYSNAEIEHAPTTQQNHLLGSKRDFYSVVAHEIGHVLGYVNKTNPARIQVGPHSWVNDIHHSGDNADLMAPVAPWAARQTISSDDASRTKYAKATSLVAAATQGAPELAVRWSDPSNGKAGYTVYRSTKKAASRSAAGAVAVGSVPAGAEMSFTDTSAAVGAVYYYFVAPSVGKGKEATASGWRSAGLTAGAVVQASTAKPTQTVTWSAVPGATWYEVWGSDTDGASIEAAGAEQLGIMPAGQTQWLDATASPYAGHYYWIRACFGPGGSGPTADFPVAAGGFTAPVVTGTVTAISGDVNRVDWDPVPGAPRYNVYRAVDTGVTDRSAAGASLVGTVQQIVGPAENPYLLEGHFGDVTAVRGQAYRYWVTVVVDDPINGDPNKRIEAALGGSAVATRDAALVQSVGSVRATDTSGLVPGSAITVTWDAYPGAVSYEVYVGEANETTRPSSAYHFNVTQPSTGWGFGHRSRFWIVANMPGGAQVELGSDVGTGPNFDATGTPDGIHVIGLPHSPSPNYYEVYRTTSTDDFDVADLTFLGPLVGSASAYDDPTAVSGVAYHYFFYAWFIPHPGSETSWLYTTPMVVRP